jgi:hypothetical protein
VLLLKADFPDRWTSTVDVVALVEIMLQLQTEQSLRTFGTVQPFPSKKAVDSSEFDDILRHKQ